MIGTMFDNVWWQTNNGPNRVLKIDPDTSTSELIGPDLGSNKYACIVEGGNGCLYCAPGNVVACFQRPVVRL